MMCVSGSEPVAADAGQVPDHVRPDHLTEYPLCVQVCMRVCIRYTETE